MGEEPSDEAKTLPSVDQLNEALSGVREGALAAIAWYDEDPTTFPSPLAYVRPTLENFELLATEELGERGFQVDVELKAVKFNATYLRGIVSSVTNAFTTRYGFTVNEADAIAERAVGLYVFHELFHINQNFIDHELAGIIKEAFGPDELSKLDVYADVIAAHCQAFIEQAGDENSSQDSYLNAFASNITLSYNVLTGAFATLSDHKKRRALGLATSRVLIQKVVDTGDQDDELWDLATSPVYASVSLKTGHLVALVSREAAWEILFSTKVDDVGKLQELWDQTGVLPPEDLIALLLPLSGTAIPTGSQRATKEPEAEKPAAPGRPG